MDKFPSNPVPDKSRKINWSNIFNGIMSICAIGALCFTYQSVQVSKTSTEISNQALELTRKSLNSSDSSTNKSLSMMQETADAIKDLAGSSRGLTNASRDNLNLSKIVTSAQLNEYKRNLSRYLSEYEPNLKLDKLKIPQTIGNKLIVELSLRSYGKQRVKIDMSTFHFKVTKSVENPFYPENIYSKPETLSQWKFVRMYPNYVIYESPKQYILNFDLNQQELNDINENKSVILFFGEVYYMNLIRDVNVCYSICIEMKNFVDTGNELLFDSDIIWEDDITNKILPGFEPDSLFSNSFH